MNDEAQRTCWDAQAVVDAPEPTTGRRNSTEANARRAVFYALVVSLIALLVALAWPMLRGEVYVADDLGEFHLPLRAFYAQQLAKGESFDWCPELYCGFYLTGEGQVGGYHPLHWLLYRTLPLSLAFDLECWLSYPLMLVGLYVLLMRWRLGRESALFGAMVFSFGGFNLLHFVHPNAIAVIAHIPWLLFGIDVAMRTENSKHRLWAWATVGVLSGSQLLLGYPQYVLYTVFVELGYVLLIGLTTGLPHRVIFRGLASWAAAILLGILIAAVQLLPTFDLLQHSVRRTMNNQLATQGSLHPLNLLQLVAPYLLSTRVVGQNTHELGIYIGAVPLALAAWHLSNRENRRRFRLLTLAAIVAAGFGLIWSFGGFGPFAWLEQSIPLVNKFRLPCRAIVIFQFGMAMIAALGFADLITQGQSRRTSEKLIPSRPLWLLPIAALTIAAVGPVVWPQFTAAWPLIAVGPILLLIATCVVKLASNGTRWAIPALVIFTSADLAVYGMSESMFQHSQPLADFVEQTDGPPGNPNFRVAADLACGLESAPGQNGLRTGDRILLTGWKRVDGYAGLEPARTLDYREATALQVAGVGWISNAAGVSANLQPPDHVTKNSTEGWFSLPNPSVRARLVTDAVIGKNPAADLANIALNQALVDEPLNLAAGTPGVAILVADRPGRIVVKSNCSTDQLLVVNESYYPGWKASTDGSDAKLIRVNGDFMGVVAPAGRHELCLEFRPESMRIGRLASCFGLGLLVVTFLLGATLPRLAKR
jgi:hypothetical protein